MAKRILLVTGVIIVVLILLEVIALLQLKNSVTKYAEYWKNSSSEGEFTYVILGDSAAQSIGASKPEYGYVGLLADRIEQKTGKTVRIVNLSKSGATIEDAINNQAPELSKYKPDLITVEVGANDIVRGVSTNEFSADFEELLKNLPKDAFVANLPYFGGRIRKNDEAVSANKTIAELTRKYSMPLVDLQNETRERDSWRNYSQDLFHPSNRGYQVWADAFWNTIEPTL